MNRYQLLFLLIIPTSLFANTNQFKFKNPTTSTIHNVKNETNSNILSRRVNVSLELQEMYTTHGTNFNGFGGILNYQLSPSYSVGIGVEYVHSGFHPDNGWDLTRLNFIPVFIDSKLNLTKPGKVTSFAHLSTGVTFKNYQKVWSDNPSPEYASRYKVPPTGIFNISEKGWYMYSGLGVSCKLSNKLSAYIDVGLKAFHLSWNPWEINPHGLSIKLGVTL